MVAQIMKIISKHFSELFNLEDDLTFLVGAGCSIDPPSSLPSAKKMMRAIVEFFCEKSSKNTILQYLDEMRFEYLLGLLQDFHDNDLKVLEFYNLSKSPNLQHYFIANMIKNGKQVITTNYDSLIELALVELGVDLDDIVPIITKQEFISHPNPYEISRNGKFPLIKVHGSVENIISGENTKESIKATIKSLGEEKKGIDIFKIEDFKIPTIQKVLNGKTLIIIGYSGMDDFDIIPTLFTIKKYEKIIWIYHDYEIEDSRTYIYKISDNPETKYSNKIKKLLSRFKKLGLVNHAYLVKANTSKLVKELISIKVYINKQDFDLNLLEWFKDNLKPLSILKRLYFPQKILLDRYAHRKSLKIAKQILKKARLLSKDFWVWISYRNLGLIYHRKNKFKKAINYHEKSLKIARRMKDDTAIAGSNVNLGDVYADTGDLKKVYSYYKIAGSIYERYQNHNALIHLYHNAGMLFQERGKKYYTKSSIFLKKAEKLVRDSSDILKKAKVYGSYANIIFLRGNNNKALYYYNKALEIVDNLNLLHYIGIYLGSIGMVQLKRNQYIKAIDTYFKAISIHKEEGDKKQLAAAYNNIAGVYYKLKDYPLAYKYSKKSTKLFKQIGMKRSPIAIKARKNMKIYNDKLKKIHKKLKI